MPQMQGNLQAQRGAERGAQQHADTTRMSTTPDILTPRDSTTTGVFADAAGSAAMRGAMARLCRAVSSRMMPDEPTPEDRLELMEAYAAACALLESCQPNEKADA
jgi:hypothetical protein